MGIRRILPAISALRPLWIVCAFGIVGVLCDWPHLLGLEDENIVFAHALGLLAVGCALGALDSGRIP